MTTTAPTVDPWTPCQDQDAAETMPQYAARVLGYAMAYGCSSLTLAQLEIADAQAARHVAQLPQEMDHGAAVLDRHLHDTRTRLQLSARRKRAQLAALGRQLADLDAGTPNPDDAPGGQPGPEMTDQDRALNLLRAALTLIMGPQPPQGGGGRPALLVRPKPTKPSPGIALDTPQGDGIAF